MPYDDPDLDFSSVAARPALNYEGLLRNEATKQGVDPEHIVSLSRAESSLNPSARSPKGAVGLMQVMPATGRRYGVKPLMLADPATNARVGVSEYKRLLGKYNDPKLAVAAYNAGEGAVDSANGVPRFQETKNHVKKVIGGAKYSDPDLDFTHAGGDPDLDFGGTVKPGPVKPSKPAFAWNAGSTPIASPPRPVYQPAKLGAQADSSGDAPHIAESYNPTPPPPLGRNFTETVSPPQRVRSRLFSVDAQARGANVGARPRVLPGDDTELVPAGSVFHPTSIADIEAQNRAINRGYRSQAMEQEGANTDARHGAVVNTLRHLGSNVLAGAGETISGIVGGVARLLPGQAAANVVQTAKELQETASDVRARQGQGVANDLAYEAGALAPKMVSGGPVGFGVTSALDAAGHGATLPESIKQGVSAAATAKLGGVLANRLQRPLARAPEAYMERAAGNVLAPVITRAATGGGLDVTPSDIIFGGAFGLHGGSEQSARREAAEGKAPTKTYPAQYGSAREKYEASRAAQEQEPQASPVVVKPTEASTESALQSGIGARQPLQSPRLVKRAGTQDIKQAASPVGQAPSPPVFHSETGPVGHDEMVSTLDDLLSLIPEKATRQRIIDESVAEGGASYEKVVRAAFRKAEDATTASRSIVPNEIARRRALKDESALPSDKDIQYVGDGYVLRGAEDLGKFLTWEAAQEAGRGVETASKHPQPSLEGRTFYSGNGEKMTVEGGQFVGRRRGLKTAELIPEGPGAQFEQEPFTPNDVVKREEATSGKGGDGTPEPPSDTGMEGKGGQRNAGIRNARRILSGTAERGTSVDLSVDQATTPDRTTASSASPARGLTRNFRVGNNDASMTFADDSHRDLYDLGAKMRYLGRGGQNKPSQRAVGDIAGLRKSLAERLNVPQADIGRMAMDTLDDVKAQMKGVKHGEGRQLVNNVKPPTPTLTTLKNRAPRNRAVNPESDSLLAAIQKIGFDSTTPEGADLARYLSPREGGRPGMVNNQRLNGGERRGIDNHLIRSLQEAGFDIKDSNDLMNKVRQEQGGKPVYSTAYDHAAQAARELKPYLKANHSPEIAQTMNTLADAINNHSEFGQLSDKIAHGEATDAEIKRFGEVGRYELNIDPDAIQSFIETHENAQQPQGRGAEPGIEAGQQAVSGAERAAGEREGDVGVRASHDLVPSLLSDSDRMPDLPPDQAAAGLSRTVSSGNSGTTKTQKFSPARTDYIHDTLDRLTEQARATKRSLSDLIDEHIAQAPLLGQESTAFTPEEASMARSLAADYDAARSTRRAPVKEQAQSLLDASPTLESKAAIATAQEQTATDALANSPLFEGKPDWVNQNLNVLTQGAEKSGLADRIEASAIQRKTAKETARELGTDVDTVRAVRAKRGIPSMDDATEFEKWLTDRRPPGHRELQHQIETEVADRQGNPLVMYHGTGKDFEAFDKNAKYVGGSRVPTSELGFWFTAEPGDEGAGMYAKPTGRLISAHLEANSLYEMPYDEFLKFEQGEKSRGVAKSLYRKLKEQGYDGIHVADTKLYAVFEPEQVHKLGEKRFVEGVEQHHSLTQPRDPDTGQFKLEEPAQPPAKGEHGQFINALFKSPDVDNQVPSFLANPEVRAKLGLPRTGKPAETKDALAKAMDLPRSSHISPEALRAWASENGLGQDALSAIDSAHAQYRAKLRAKELGGRDDDPDIITRYRNDLGKKSSDLSGTLLSDPERGYKAVTVLGYDLYQTAKDFGNWSRQMVGRLGERIRPMLRDLWNGIKNSDFVKDERGFVRLDTPEFKRWFGKSKVVDEKGEPLPVYHGTDADFSAFDVAKIGRESELDTDGFFFTSNPSHASSYATRSAIGNERVAGGNVMSVYLSLKAPAEIQARGDAIERWDNDVKYQVDKLKEAGHDGVIIKSADGNNLYVAFEPQQIKSATGNSGEFNPNSSSLTDPPFVDKVKSKLLDLFPGERPPLPPGFKGSEGGFLRFGGRKATPSEAKLFDDVNKLESEEGEAKSLTDFIIKVRRAMLFSSVKTIGKLGNAVAGRVGITPIEEGIGGVLGKVPGISRIAAKAPREGGLSLAAERSAISNAFSKQTLRDMKQVAKTGASSLDIQYGGKDVDTSPEAIEFFGRLHGAMKAPAKRAEFYRALEKRTAFAVREAQTKGVDDAQEYVQRPDVQAAIGAKAYEDAQRAIFMNDNGMTEAYKTLRQLAESKGALGKATSNVMRFLLPVVKVPTNYVIESSSYGIGAAKALGQVISAKGVENLTPDQADYVMRNLKKQTIGAAMMAIGYFGAASVGGYFQEGEKRAKGEPEAGGLQVFGVNIPKFLLHTPALEALQIGATLRRVADKQESLKAGIVAAGKGLVEEIPFFNEPARLVKAAKDSTSAAKFAGETVRSMLVPPDVQTIAKMTDKQDGKEIRRYPEGFADTIKVGIPGLRQQVRGGVPVERTADENAIHEADRAAHPLPPMSDLKKTEVDAKSEITRAMQSHDKNTPAIIQKHIASGAIKQEDVYDIADKASKSDEQRMIDEFKKVPLEQKVDLYLKLSPAGRAKVRQEFQEAAMDQLPNLTPLQQKTLGPKIGQALRAQ